MHHSNVRDNLASQSPLNVLFLNDVGFQYGAGIAMLRQIQSFLVMGHTVAALSWVQGPVEATVPPTPRGATGKWLGLTTLNHIHNSYGLSSQTIVDALVIECGRFDPDVIIVGNLHGANWPLEVLPALRTAGYLVIAYMHDTYLISGRCAYPGDCLMYRSGCNESCPTWDQYPRLEPHLIFDQWLLRRQIFCGADGIPIAANSHWTLSMAKDAFPNLTYGECIYYGLDSDLFAPLDQKMARMVLGIPENKFVVLGGCVDINDYRKGGHIFNQVVPQLKDNVHFLVFGANSAQLDGVQGTGFIRDYRKMPLVFNAADLFVGTSLEEAFGQTFCEAAACGIPTVAFNVGGIPEVARDDYNAQLVEQIDADAMIKAIQYFMNSDDSTLFSYKRNARQMVEEEFTFKAQGLRWEKALISIENAIAS